MKIYLGWVWGKWLSLLAFAEIWALAVQIFLCLFLLENYDLQESLSCLKPQNSLSVTFVCFYFFPRCFVQKVAF